MDRPSASSWGLDRAVDARGEWVLAGLNTVDNLERDGALRRRSAFFVGGSPAGL